MENIWHKQSQKKTKKLKEQKPQSDSKYLTGDITEKIVEYVHAKKVDDCYGLSHRLKGISKRKALGSDRTTSEATGF